MRSISILVAVAALACAGRAGPPPPAPAAAPATAAADGPVVAIELAGLPAARVAAARSALATRIGAPLAAADVARDVRAIWALGGVADVTVAAIAAPGGVAVRFVVVEHPRVAAIRIVGAADAGLVDAHVAFDDLAGAPLDPAALRRARGELERACAVRGHALARVSWTTPAAPGGGVELRVRLDEGPRVALGGVRFRGNQQVSAGALAAIVAGAGGAIGGPYQRTLLAAAPPAISAAYYDRGHVDVHVGPIEERFAADRRQVELVIPIDEGPRYRLGTLSVDGTLVAPPAEYLRRLGVARGQVFVRSRIADGIRAILALHREHGAPTPQIEPRSEIDTARRLIDLRFEISTADARP